MSVARSSSLPADSLLGSPMEFAGQLRPSGACNLLAVPALSSPDVDDDEGDFVIGIRPKSSPLPRRKSSLSDEDLELVPPPCGSRRVSFADAVGLNLVQVKEFDTWDVPKLSDFDSSEGREKDSEEYFISPSNFSLPLPPEELFTKVRDQKVELETIELLPGTTILKGVIRVLNVSFDKAVYVRTSLNSWSSHFDLLAEYIPGSSQGLMDCFSFRLTLVPPFREQGARVDFCLRYETPVGTFWANNGSRNYTLFCHQKAKEEVERPRKEYMKKKSCLKTVSQNFPPVENTLAVEAPCQENNQKDISKQAEEEALKVKESIDDHSGTSEGDDQQLPTKSRRSSSRRSRRKAARMARVRDYFSQRNGEDAEKDRSPSEARSEQNSDIKFVSEALKEMSPAPGDNPSNHTEKSESVGLSDSSDLRGGESASDTPNNILHPRDKPENQNISRFESAAEESTLKEDHESRNESVPSSESFTFGTVVAPLYRQAFVSADKGISTPNVNEGSSLRVSDEIIHPNQRCLDSLQNFPKTIPAEAEEHPNATGISRTDVSDVLILAEGSDLSGEDLALDLQRQTTAETFTQVQPKPDEPQKSLETLKSSEFSGSVSETLESSDSCLDTSRENEFQSFKEFQKEHEDMIRFFSAKAAEDKNWEMMVEEDEMNLLTDDEEISIQAGDIEAVEEDDIEQFEDAGRENVSENKDAITAEEEGRREDDETEDEDLIFSKGKQEEDQVKETAVEEDDIQQFGDAERETNATAEEDDEDEEMEGEAANVPVEEQVGDHDKETTREEEYIQQSEDAEKETVSGHKDATTEEDDEDEETANSPEENQVGDQDKEKAVAENNIQQFEDVKGETMSENNDATAEEEDDVLQELTGLEETEDEAANVPEETQNEVLEEVTDVGTREYPEKAETLASLEFDAGLEIEEEEHTEENENVESQGDEGLNNVKIEDGEKVAVCFEERSESAQNKAEDGSSKKSVNGKENTEEEEFLTQQTVTGDEDGGTFADGGLCISDDKLDDDEISVSSASSNSDSDDEVELYMHCLRAVHTGPQANKDSGFGVGRRSSVNRSKLLSTPMPSISESVDEEQNLSGFQESLTETGDYEFTAAENEEDNIRPVSWWRETFSCRNIGKTLLYAALFLLFLVVARHYDFIACFGLYLMSLVWLWFQGERQKVNSSKRIS